MSQENVEIVRRIFTTINDRLDLPRELHDRDRGEALEAAGLSE